MWSDGGAPPLGHLIILGARALVHVERYVRNLLVEAWEGRNMGHGNDSSTYRVREAGRLGIESRNVALMEPAPIKLNTNDPNHGDTGTGFFSC